MDKLFKEELENYDLLQLENWIRRYRTVIKKDDFNSNTAEDDYKKAVLDFVEEWKEHSKDEKNKDIYKKGDFQKAILANGIPLDKIVLILKSDTKERKVDITERLYDLFLEDKDLGIFNNLMSDYEEKRINKINDYFDLISALPSIDDYKIKIVELIRNKTKYEILTYTTVIDDETIFEIDNVDDLIEALLSAETIEEPIIFEAIEKEENQFLDSLRGFEITRQVFYDFKDDAYSKEVSNKYFQKKFFINVGLYLSLNLDLYEMLLNLFGYTIKNSRIERDKLIADFVYIGLDKEYIDISIEANSLRPLSARVAGYQKRDINYINEFLKERDCNVEAVKKFRTTLLFAISKVRSFINHKEDSIKRKANKLNRLKDMLEVELEKLSIVENELAEFEMKHPKTEEEYKKEISENRQEISVLKNKPITSISEKEDNTKEVRKLTEINRQLIDEKNRITAKTTDLNRVIRNHYKKLEGIQARIKNTIDQKERVESTKYKSIDIFKEHIEEYNNLTLSDVKDLLERFEDLYNKDYKLKS